MNLLKRYLFIIIGIGFLLLGLLAWFNFFSGDLSKNAGKGLMISGVFFFVYFFIRKSISKNKT